jgi:hypothetical protein
MKNTIKKLSLIVATAALFFFSTANVYASDNFDNIETWADNPNDPRYELHSGE